MDFMSDTHCMDFLQWALPQLGLRWQGFRKVHRQVCKRLTRRLQQLALADFNAYRARLEEDPAEWRVLDICCHITISRFFRDRGIFEVLRRLVLPEIAARARREGRDAHIWSAGCASGEEPFTVKMLWDLEVAHSIPRVALSIVATDIDATMLARARNACFAPTSLHELPQHLVAQAFDRAGPLFRVKPQHRDGIDFLHQDLRSQVPAQRFDLILCRYVAFTYFSLPLQQKVLARMLDRLLPDGYFAIGPHEGLPEEVPGLAPMAGTPQIFRKTTIAP
jgi:chemotaxis protein methyltransferase CheR